MIPKELEILGLYFAIDSSQTSDQLGSLGKMNYKTQTISVAADQAPAAAFSTLVHEIIEAVNFMLRLRLSEGTICRLETGLSPALMQVMTYMVEGDPP